jgi:signal transduction histidine kinase
MRDRVGALAGRVSIVTAIGEGTRVCGFAPVRDAAAGD